MKPTTTRFLEVLQELHAIGVDYADDVITRSKLSHLRTGRTEVSIDLVVDICNKNKVVNPAYIINGDGPILFPDYTTMKDIEHNLTAFSIQELSMKTFAINQLLETFTKNIALVINNI